MHQITPTAEQAASTIHFVPPSGIERGKTGAEETRDGGCTEHHYDDYDYGDDDDDDADVLTI